MLYRIRLMLWRMAAAREMEGLLRDLVSGQEGTYLWWRADILLQTRPKQ